MLLNMDLSIERVTDRLNFDFNTIIRIILKKLGGNLISIIVYGSHGRDEGAFIISKNKVYAYNDYDILLIVSNKIHSSELSLIEKMLKQLLKVQWVDISQMTVKSMSKLNPTMYNYDLKYGSRVIYGLDNVLDLIPKFKNTDITLLDAEILYFTRMWTFLGSIMGPIRSELIGEKSRLFRYQMAKAVFAIVDANLIINKSYTSSYKERVSILRNLQGIPPELSQLATWALNEKLRPKDIVMSEDEVEDMYSNVIKMYFNVMFKVLGLYYGKELKNSFDLERAKKNRISELSLFIKSSIKKRSFTYYSRSIKIQMLQSFVAESYIREGDIRERLILKSIKIARSLGFEVNNNHDELRLFTANIRNNS